MHFKKFSFLAYNQLGEPHGYYGLDSMVKVIILQKITEIGCFDQINKGTFNFFFILDS